MVVNKKGMATIEALPMLVVFVIFFSYTYGFFSVIHSGILYSIGARAYAFETFRNRANLTYFRGNNNSESYNFYTKVGHRYHCTRTRAPEIAFIAEKRAISIGMSLSPTSNSNADIEIHNDKIHDLDQRNRDVKVNPIWIKTCYGICVTPGCGD
ncbi:MAG: hypothetical protein MK008_09450 [Bdellovibrionales bacterium]|nr:hypothetical protein [Bdellovibrionales bacterium]